MKLAIYSIQKLRFQGEAKSVNCNTHSGQITVLDHHIPLITILEKGPMVVKDSQGQEHFFEISSGFLEVRQGNQVRCLVD